MERVVELAIAIDRRQVERRLGLAVEVDDEQVFGELLADRDETGILVVDQTLAVERDDVLAVVRRARGVDVDHRPAHLFDVPADQCVPLVPLAGIER